MKYKTLHSEFLMTTTQIHMEFAELLMLSKVQRKRLPRFLYLMHHVINLTEKKIIKNKDINQKNIYHHLVKNM